MKKVLIVANQTLCEQHLLAEVEQRREEGPVAFHVLVPSAASPWRWALAGPDAMTWAPIDAELDPTEDAQARLAQFFDALADAGVAATGRTSAANPVAAVEELLAEERFDEIVVSTFPQGISRWLRGDVVDRIRSRTGLPVTHVVPGDVPLEA